MTEAELRAEIREILRYEPQSLTLAANDFAVLVRVGARSSPAGVSFHEAWRAMAREGEIVEKAGGLFCLPSPAESSGPAQKMLF